MGSPYKEAFYSLKYFPSTHFTVIWLCTEKRVERGSVTFQGVFRTKVSLTSSLLILSLEPFKTPDSAPTPTGLRHRQPHQEHFCTRGKVLSVYAKQNPADYLCQCGFHSLGGSCGMWSELTRPRPQAELAHLTPHVHTTTGEGWGDALREDPAPTIIVGQKNSWTAP